MIPTETIKHVVAQLLHLKSRSLLPLLLSGSILTPRLWAIRPRRSLPSQWNGASPPKRTSPSPLCRTTVCPCWGWRSSTTWAAAWTSLCTSSLRNSVTKRLVVLNVTAKPSVAWHHQEEITRMGSWDSPPPWWMRGGGYLILSLCVRGAAQSPRCTLSLVLKSLPLPFHFSFLHHNWLGAPGIFS